MNTEERKLADLLHRIAPEPPRRVTVEQVAYRLVSEPRRLWYRYLYHNPRFVALFVRQLYGQRTRGKAIRPQSLTP